LGVGLDTDDLALYKRIIVKKSKELKTRCNLAESSKENYGLKGTVLPVKMMI
jgi:hypothetical protein